METFARGIRDEARRYQPDLVLDRLVASGDLRRSEGPRLFRYTISDDSGLRVEGVLGAAPAGELLPHEQTTMRPSSPSPGVEIRPILAICREPIKPPSEAGPGLVVVDAEGMRHEVAPLESGATAPAGPYVVADGHHRRRAALETWGEDSLILTLLVGSSGAGLDSGGYHRRFSRADALPPAAAERFDISVVDELAPVPGSLVWVDGASGSALLLTPRPDALAGMPPEHRRSEAAVATALLYPLIGVSDQDAIHVGSPAAATAGLGSGEGAVLLPTIDVATVLAAALAGTPLPPKSSRFRPKPLRGVVLRVAGA